VMVASSIFFLLNVFNQDIQDAFFFCIHSASSKPIFIKNKKYI